MVKFMFVSMFLTLTTMSTLVFAALPKHTIKIRYLDFFLFSDGHEKPGDPVTLVPAYNPSTTVFSFPSLRPFGSFESEVIGKAGLFVSTRENSLFWERQPYIWKFREVSPFAEYLISEAVKPLFWVQGEDEAELHLQAGIGNVFTINRVAYT